MVNVAREGVFSTAWVGFFKATCAGFSALVRVDSVRSFFVFLETVGAVFAVITWTTSLVASSLRMSPPNEDGAKPWACTPALKVTETNAVASAKKIRSPRTSARYAGNHKSWQAFFLIKDIGNRPLKRYQIFRLRRNNADPRRFSRPENNPAQIRAEDRTFGRGPCKLDFDDEAWVGLRPALRLQCARTANAGSIARRM